MKVLVVEDNLISKAVIVKTLQPHFEVIHHAPNGESGLDLWKIYNHEIVITDYNMPKINGLELIEVIRHNDVKYNTYIVLISTDFVENDYNNRKYDDFVAKPFTPKELVARIKDGLVFSQKLKHLIHESKH